MTNEKCYSVYVHCFPNGKNYVGLTKQCPETRWGYKGLGYKKQPVYSAICEYGWDNIEHVIIKNNLDFEGAQLLEKNLIKELDAINNGYNISDGGNLGSNEWVLIEYNNDYYTPTELLQFSNVQDLTTHDITTRLSHWWDVEKILNKPKTRKNTTFEYQGKKYTAKELVSISTVEGITDKNILTRILKHGWSVDRAITQQKNIKNQPKGCRNKDKECLFEYNGKLYKTYELLELSNVEGLTTSDITNRINKHGWSVYDSITKPKKKQNQKFEYKGNWYTSKELASLSPYDNITHHDITDRINRCGWTVHDAIYKPKKQK